MRFNPPPSWPVPPPGWIPWEGWSPDPAWGPAPDGWQLLVEDDATEMDEPPPAPEPDVAPEPDAVQQPEPDVVLKPEPAPEPSTQPPAPPTPAATGLQLTPLPTSGAPQVERGSRRTVLEVVGALLALVIGSAIGYAVRGQHTVQLAAPPPIVRVSVSPTPTPVPTTVYVGSTADPGAPGGPAAPAPSAPLTDQGITLQSVSLRSVGGKEAASVRLTNDGSHTFDVAYTVTVLGDHGQLLATLTGSSKNVHGGKTVTGQLTSPDNVVTQLSSIAFQVDAKTKK